MKPVKIVNVEKDIIEAWKSAGIKDLEVAYKIIEVLKEKSDGNIPFLVASAYAYGKNKKA